MNKEELPKYFSYSQLRLYEKCPRCYYYKYVLGKQPKKDLNLAFGSAIHKGLEVFYKGRTKEEAQNAFIKELTESDIRLKAKDSVEKMGKMGLKMIKRYIENQERPFFNVSKVEHWFETELKDPVTEKSLDIPFRGIMDIITKEGFIVDHKTSSSSWDETMIQEDLQSACYMIAYKSIFGEMPAGFMYNFLIKRVKDPKFDTQPVEVNVGKMLYFIDYAQHIVNQIREGNFPKRRVGGRYEHICI